MFHASLILSTVNNKRQFLLGKLVFLMYIFLVIDRAIDPFWLIQWIFRQMIKIFDKNTSGGAVAPPLSTPLAESVIINRPKYHIDGEK